LTLTKPATAFDGDSQPTLAEGIRLVPQDDGIRDPTFDAFRNRLRQAAADRDVAFLESVLDAKVHVSFGPDDRGLTAFRTVWRPQDANSKLWPKLHASLALAATGGDGSFWIPYVYARWPAEFDPHTYAAVGDDVVLREKPSASDVAVARLSYHIVRIARDASENGEWQRVEIPNLVAGYVPSRSLLRPNAFRIQCVNSGGPWRIAVLIDGD
jgi:hypothetical protein